MSCLVRCLTLASWIYAVARAERHSCTYGMHLLWRALGSDSDSLETLTWIAWAFQDTWSSVSAPSTARLMRHVYDLA